MGEYKIYNPTAGNGKNKKIDNDCYYTKHKGDCKNYIIEKCKEDPNAHFVIYGGDGTINESVNALLCSNFCKNASVTFIPVGSGNDTVKSLPTSLPQSEGTYPLDVIKLNNIFSINMINIGFDCNVVSSASMFKNKWKIAGKVSYILGVITEFFKPFGEFFNINAVCENGSNFSYSGACMLCAVCNGEWCGGSFHNSPNSRMNDGIIELLIVKKVNRFQFLKLIGKYKNGTLFDKSGTISMPEFADKVSYIRIKSMEITGLKQICFDGEIIPCTEAKISVIPKALNYRIIN